MSGDWFDDEDGNLPTRFEESKALPRDGTFDSIDKKYRNLYPCTVICRTPNYKTIIFGRMIE